MKKGLIVIGSFVHALDKLSSKCLSYCSKGAIVVRNDGTIERVLDMKHDDSSLLETQWTEYERITLKPSQIVIPGMIDTHAHAPQYFNCGLGLDMPLLEWLNTYTFPVESKFKELQIAIRVYTSCVRRSLMNGTTTSVYFGTIHNDATILLAKIIEEIGQRAYVGKVSMDRFAPEYYCEDTHQGIDDVRKFMEQMKHFHLVKPILTPRFAVSCSEEMMKGLAEIYNEYDVPIQSHISENTGEVKLVSELFPSSSSYAEVYDKVGLLTEKTILAHGVYLTDSEIELIKSRKSTIAHCPLSNFSLCSGVLNVRKLINRGVKVSMGTDISGGYSSSMFNSIRNTLIATASSSTDHIRTQTEASEDTVPITIDEAFYIATVGGAEALNIQSRVGNFVEGKSFDALIIDVDVKDGSIDSFNDLYSEVFTTVPAHEMEEKKLRENFSRFIFNGDDRNISQVFVQGRDVTLNLRD